MQRGVLPQIYISSVALECLTSPEVFKSTSSYIYLTILYTLSILSGYFAFDWRKMFIIGYVSGIANHRLVNTKNKSERPYFGIIILIEGLCQLYLSYYCCDAQNMAALPRKPAQ